MFSFNYLFIYSFIHLCICREGGDIVPKKGARIVWALDGRFLIVSGFGKVSERQIMIYDTKVSIILAP